MGALTASLEKEFRAVVPVWLAAVGAALVAASRADSRLSLLAVLALVLGPIATGAQAMGYEYSHRTLGLVLAQPMPRGRHLALKLGLLAVLLVALLAVARLALGVHAGRDAGAWWLSPEPFVLAMLYGLLVAPWMALVSRSVLGGVVFAPSLAAILALAGAMYGARVHGAHAAGEIDASRLLFLWRGSLALAAVSAAALWWQFTRLEAIEGHRAVSLPRWVSSRTRHATGARRRHPAWMLLKKELRLQQMTFVVALLYVVTATAVVLVTGQTTVRTFEWLLPLTIVYLGILAVLAGALASAEERQVGTIQWQLLLPVPWRMQWGVKLGVVLALTVLLAIAMPAAFISLAAPVLYLPPQAVGGITVSHAVLVLGLASTSLYLSSISSSGVRAMVLMAPLAAAFSFGWPSFLRLAGRVAGILAAPMAGLLRPHGWRVPWEMVVLIPMATAVGLASVLMLFFAARNHRTADAPPVLAQTTVIVAALFVGLVLARLILAALYGTWVLR